jgi:hypothetical protein
MSLVLVLVLVVGIGVAAGVVFKTSDQAKPHKPAPPVYPKAWDRRIAPLAAIASKYRGLKYKHPVFVEFLSNKEFNKVVTTKDDDLTSAQQTSEAEYEGGLRALGYVSGGVNMLSQSNTLNSSGILAFYSPSDKKIRVRGSVLTAAIKVTLVHELTHVLQDQYFDIAGTERRLGKSNIEDDWAYHAIVEGDARRIEHKYQNSLPKAVQKQLNKQDVAQSKSIDHQTKNVPPYLIADMQAPYDLGEIAVTRAARGGNTAVNKLFRVPPVHEIQLMEPWLLGAKWTNHRFVMPTLAKGQKKLWSSEFGAYYLYAMLAEREPLAQALATADGWGGDSVIEYTQDKVTCAKIAFTGRDAGSTRKIYTGLQRWSAGMGGSAHVALTQSTIGVTACDPGKTFKAARDRTLDAEQLLTFRNGLESDTEKNAPSHAVAICYANGIVNYLGLSALTLRSVTPAQRQAFNQIGYRCVYG